MYKDWVDRLWRGCCAGRRDDLWSWLYVLVEMLDGTLPWRKSSADRGATQRVKEECVANPERLCSHVVMPGKPRANRMSSFSLSASYQSTSCRVFQRQHGDPLCTHAAGPLVNMSNHLMGLGFEDAPNYDFLHSCLDSLTDVHAVLPGSASAGSLMGSLDDDYPLPAATFALPAPSMPLRLAPATVAQPGSQTSTQTPDSIPSFAMSEPMNGHPRTDPGAAVQGRVTGAGFGFGLYSGDANGSAQHMFIADTPRSPPEETDLLYGDLPGISDAPPLPAGPPPAILPSPFLRMPKAMPAAQQATLSSQPAHDEAARGGQLRGACFVAQVLTMSVISSMLGTVPAYLVCRSVSAGVSASIDPLQKSDGGAATLPPLPSNQRLRCGPRMPMPCNLVPECDYRLHADLGCCTQRWLCVLSYMCALSTPVVPGTRRPVFGNSRSRAVAAQPAHSSVGMSETTVKELQKDTAASGELQLMPDMNEKTQMAPEAGP